MTPDITKMSEWYTWTSIIRLVRSHELQGLVIWKGVLETCQEDTYVDVHYLCSH